MCGFFLFLFICCMFGFVYTKSTQCIIRYKHLSTHNHFDSLKLHNAVDAHFSYTLVFKLLRIFDIAIK